MFYILFNTILVVIATILTIYIAVDSYIHPQHPYYKNPVQFDGIFTLTYNDGKKEKLDFQGQLRPSEYYDIKSFMQRISQNRETEKTENSLDYNK